MNRTESIEISETELIGAIGDTVPIYSPFGPVLQLSQDEYALCAAVKLPNDWNGGPVKVRVNHQRQDTDTVSAGVVLHLLAPGSTSHVPDSGTPVAVDLGGAVTKFSTSAPVEVTPQGTWTGAEFLGIWLSVPEPTVDFRTNVRSIEVQFERALCETPW